MNFTQSILTLCPSHTKMTSTESTQINIINTFTLAPNSSEHSIEPPAKKQKCLEAISVTDIKRILECPVCFKTPECPDEVQFCSNGHLVCNGCHKNILDKNVLFVDLDIGMVKIH